jgi:OmpA-OmpF porin, OOP family
MGHQSMGGFDIYRTKLQSKNLPENLGEPINSTGDDIFFHFSTDGKRAYFSSNRLKGDHYDMDIYVIEPELPPVIVMDDVVKNVPVSPPDTILTEKPDALTVYFGFEDATLEKEFKTQIDQIFASIRLKQNTKIELHGYSDNKGSSKFNYDLSLQRANEVKAYLESKGIKNFITVTPHGEDDPVEDNKTLEGRVKNRRVEIIFSEGKN